MKVLVVGGGAREHAIAEALAKDADVYAFMPMVNPGIRKIAKEFAIGKMDDLLGAVAFAKKSEAEFAVIGPEAPLAAGMVDALEKEGIPCVGPTKELAQLETSKSFTRNLLKKYRIDASPRFKVFDKDSDSREIGEFMDELKDFVVKPDGLTGGKGVKLLGEHLKDREEAILYCNEIIGNHSSVVVEEKLNGEEFSLQTLTDGEGFLHFPPVQDHKRAFDGDEGPNTGGVGSYSYGSLLPFLTKEDVNEASKITESVAAALREEVGEYKGVLYGGFIKTAKGVKLIEYNARFGDPEAMNVLAVLETSFAEICKAVVEKKLKGAVVEFADKATVCKYVVPKGYPDKPETGRIEVPASKAQAYYAAVDEKEDGIYTTKSRSVAFVGIGNTLEEAERIAEEAADRVEGAVFHRKDIGTKELVQKRVEHMRKLK